MLWILLAAILGFGVFLYVSQDRIIFYPTRYADDSVDPPWRRLEFETRDGAQVAFYRGPESGAPEKLWLIFVGNASLALQWRPVANVAAERQQEFGYLLVDYPGYGACEGKPGRDSINRSVEAAAGALAGELELKDVAELKAVSAFLGQSLGGAVAFETAARWEAPEVVAIAPFTSMKKMAGRLFSPVLSPFVRHRWDNEARLAELVEMPGAKVTVIHGDADEVIPYDMGAALVAEHPEIAEFQSIPGAGHNDIFLRIDDQLVELLADPGQRKIE